MASPAGSKLEPALPQAATKREAPPPGPAQLRPFLLATGTTLLAGYVDAIGFAHLAGLYLSFMSGNSTRLGAALAHLDLTGLAMAGAVIASFLLGTFLGSLFAGEGAAGESRVLGAGTALIGVSCAITSVSGHFGALLPVVLAMGMQNAVAHRVAGTDIGKSFVTGTLVACGRALAQSVRTGAPYRDAGLYAVSWLTFVIGAAIGTLALLRLGLSGALAAGFALSAATFALALSRPRRA